MNASHILDSIRAKYPNNALVPELTISDPRRFDYWLPAEETRERGILPYRRIDALMFQSFERTAIEVKISRADYRLDTEEKRWPWQRVVHRFVYAVPADLDVMSPHGCGLWKVHPDGRIDIAKRPSSIARLNLCRKRSFSAWPTEPLGRPHLRKTYEHSPP